MGGGLWKSDGKANVFTRTYYVQVQSVRHAMGRSRTSRHETIVWWITASRVNTVQCLLFFYFLSHFTTENLNNKTRKTQIHPIPPPASACCATAERYRSVSRGTSTSPDAAKKFVRLVRHFYRSQFQPPPYECPRLPSSVFENVPSFIFEFFTLVFDHALYVVLWNAINASSAIY